MIFCQTHLSGSYLIDMEMHEDERGYFARTFCIAEFAAHGLPIAFKQCNLSFNKRRGILRGMHYQADPFPEGKLVRCSRGAIYDVIIDLRPESATYCQWVGAHLSAQNGRSLYIPERFAHGFVTLEDESEVHYSMTESYNPQLARGVRWNDPIFGIDWPIASPELNYRDLNLQDFLP